MFCFVDHRKLKTSAKIMNSLGRRGSLYVFLPGNLQYVDSAGKGALLSFLPSSCFFQEKIDVIALSLTDNAKDGSSVKITKMRHRSLGH